MDPALATGRDGDSSPVALLVPGVREDARDNIAPCPCDPSIPGITVTPVVDEEEKITRSAVVGFEEAVLYAAVELHGRVMVENSSAEMPPDGDGISRRALRRAAPQLMGGVPSRNSQFTNWYDLIRDFNQQSQDHFSARLPSGVNVLSGVRGLCVDFLLAALWLADLVSRILSRGRHVLGLTSHDHDPPGRRMTRTPSRRRRCTLSVAGNWEGSFV